MQDYTDALSQAASNKYDVIAAKNSYELQIVELKQLLELDPLESIEIETVNDDSNLINLVPSKIDIYNRALKILPEIHSSTLDVTMSEKNLDIAKGSYLPTLSLTGSLGSGYTSIDETNFTDQFDVNFNQKIGLSLSIPIFNRNQTKAKVNSAKINIDRSKLQLNTVKKELVITSYSIHYTKLYDRQMTMMNLQKG